MQISLRSHLIAGTAAVVGASAIAMTPVVGAQLSLPAINVPTVAKVTLAGFDSPISELLGSLILGGQLLFSTDTDVTDADLWGPTAFQIPSTLPNVVPPFDQTGTSAPVFPDALLTDELGAYTSIGALPNFIDFALPIVRQWGINGSDYLNVSVAGLSAAGIALSEGLWNAAGDLLSLDIPGALSTLSTAISDAGILALGAGAYVLSGFVTRAQAVVEALIGSLPLAIGAGVAQISLVVNKTIEVITDTFSATSLEDGWNAAIDGLFGATGIPGTVLNVTIGAGEQTGAIEYGAPPSFEPTTDSIAANYTPSIRTVVQATQVAIANALATPVPTGMAIAPVASGASLRAAAAEAATAAEAPAADSSEAAPAGGRNEAATAAEAPAAEAPAAEAPAAEAAAEKPARKAARASRGANARG